MPSKPNSKENLKQLAATPTVDLVLEEFSNHCRKTHHQLTLFNPRKHMTLIKKNGFCFLHGIHNFDFLSFCKFPFGSNLGAEKYLRKYKKMPNSTYVFQLVA